jgi:protein TonB
MIAGTSRHVSAAATSALLHGLVVLAMLPALVPQHARLSERAVEVTLELPTPPRQQAANAAPDRAALRATPGGDGPEQSAPAPGPIDAAAAPMPVPVEPDVALSLPVSEPPPVSARDFGNSTLAMAPEPELQRIAPPVETPSSLRGRELAKTAPPATPSSPNVQPEKQAPAPAQPIRQAAPRRASQQQIAVRAEGTARSDASAAIRTTVPPNDRPAQQDYLWQIIRKLSQARFRPQTPQESEQGVVVARLVIAADGRLVDIALARSSGFPELDRAVMDTIRRASPFAPLPGELGGQPHSFVVPLSYAQER